MTIPDLSPVGAQHDQSRSSPTSSGANAGTILVVGATGTVGAEVLRRLGAAGARPLALIHARNGGPVPSDGLSSRPSRG